MVLLLFFFIGGVVFAASESSSRGGLVHHRDLWPTRWPIFNLQVGGLLDLAPELGFSMEPSGSSPAASCLPASEVVRRKRESECIFVLRSRCFLHLEVAGGWWWRHPRT